MTRDNSFYQSQSEKTSIRMTPLMTRDNSFYQSQSEKNIYKDESTYDKRQ